MGDDINTNGGAEQGAAQGQQDNNAGNNQGGQQQTPPTVDYDKIQKMLDGTLHAKEETALKAYFKQQGLTQEQATQAIADFKANQAAAAPNTEELRAQAETARAAAQAAQIRAESYLLAGDIGIDTKTADYVLKLADVTDVAKEDGTVDTEKLKAALEKVLTDLPQLKTTTQQQDAGNNGTGFRPKVGADGNNNQGGNSGGARVHVTATKRWNRTNY